MNTKKTREFRVYVAQVNQTCVTVRATSREEAAMKGYRKWRREFCHSQVLSIEEQEPPR